METIIIQPKDKEELNFFLELAKRLGVKTKTYDELQDEQLFTAMVKNKETGKTDRKKIMDTLHNILNEDQSPYKNEG